MKSHAALHVHTDSSLLDGVIKPIDLLKACPSRGIEAIALTDHGNMGSHLEAQIDSEQVENCPKILFGEEFYLSKDVNQRGERERFKHLVLIAKNGTGYANLIKLNNIAWRNFYYKPRIDFKTIAENSKGLICTSACAKGIVSSFLLEGGTGWEKAATKEANKWKEVFGNDFFIEYQLIRIMHDEVNTQELINEGLQIIAKKVGIPAIITNDTHYIDKKDAKLHQKVLTLSTGGDLIFDTKDLWLKTRQELYEARQRNFPGLSNRGFKDCMAYTLEIASRCDFKIGVGGQHIPTFDHTKHPKYNGEKTKEEFFKSLCFKAMNQLGRKDDKFFNAQYQERMNRELDAIFKMKAIDYFLIVEDLIRYIREQDKLVLIRGSANGSLVCYVLKFGYIDPIEHRILFERFISPARVLSGLFDVDIDIDIESEMRTLAVKYLKEKYGDEKVCNVGSYGRLMLKAALKDMGRVEAQEIRKELEGPVSADKKAKLESQLDRFSFQEMNRVTALIEKGSKQDGGDISLEESIGKYPQLAVWWKQNKKWIQTYVEPVVGIRKSASIHPASVLVLPSHMDKWIPIRTQPNPKKKTERVICSQWECSHTGREDLRALGTMALDILGVKTLSVIAATMRAIEKNHKVKLSMANIDLNDKKTIRGFKTGETLGVFQLSAPTITQIVKDIKPDSFMDVVNLMAIDRPGALANKAHVQYSRRKHGLEKVTSFHPSVAPVVADAYGIPIYSEHIMLISMVFAGFDPVDAEKLRQLMKSKDRKIFAQFKDKFIKGAKKKHGESAVKVAPELWDTILRFGAYSFPKAHASSYGLISWTTMFLKTNYPAEFFANMLDYAANDEYSQIRSIAKRVYKVKFVMPEINKSRETFRPTKQKRIIWSLNGIKGIGGTALAEAVSKQPYTSFIDFYKRVNKRSLNKSRIEALIFAGCFRKFGEPIDLLKELYSLRQADKKKDSYDPKYDDFSLEDWSNLRAKYLGFQSRSWLAIYKAKLAGLGSITPIKEFPKKCEGQDVTLFGEAAKVRVYESSVGRIMFGTVNDTDGTVNWVVWNKMYEKLKRKVTVKDGSMILISGRKKKNRDEFNVSIDERGDVQVIK